MDYNVHSNKSTLSIPLLSKTYIRTYDFELIMRPITISLDSVTWELAKNKPNFSAWVRDQLRSERNMTLKSQMRVREIRGRRLDQLEDLLPISTAELLYHLEQLSEDSITSLVSILQGSLPQQ